MAVLDFLKEKVALVNSSFKIGVSDKDKKEHSVQNVQPPKIPWVNENFKSAPIVPETYAFDAEIGEKHPIDFTEIDKIYSDDPYAYGFVNKIVAFILGGGWEHKCDNKQLYEIIKRFRIESNLDYHIYEWVRNACKHNGYLELAGPKDKAPTAVKNVNPIYMFIKRDDKGIVKKYNLYNPYQRKLVADFDPHQIAHLKLNVRGDCAYGLGLLFSLIVVIERKHELMKNMMVLMERKANAPYHVRMGSVEDKQIPDEAAINSMKSNLEYLRNNHEWVTDIYTEIKAIDFGALGDKFTAPLELLNEEFYAGSQIPAELMGKANIPEGLSKMRMEALLFVVRSYQQEIEKVMEDQIFKRIAIANGFPDEHVEVEWGQPTPEDKRAEIESLMKVLAEYKFGTISEALRNKAEQRLMELFEFEDEDPTREGEEAQKQPKVPPTMIKPMQKESITINDNIVEFDEVQLKEYVGFDYQAYIQKIKEFIDSPEFIKRKYEGFQYTPGTDQEEWERVLIRYSLKENLSAKQIEKLRQVLKDNFDNGGSIRDISRDIMKEVKPKDLRIQVPDVTDSEGTVVKKGYERTIPKEQRAIQLARTETIRASNEGALLRFQEDSIKEVQWIAAIGERTCTFCASQNGKVIPLREAKGNLPAHVGCRCSFAAVVQ